MSLGTQAAGSVPSFPCHLEAATQTVRQKMVVGPASSSLLPRDLLLPWRQLGGAVCGFVL